jgi:N-glycosylase/DNA lyase
MNSFRVEVTDGPLDLNRIGRSGQMFRWVPNKDGWAVYEGDRLHLVQQADSVLNVTSTHDEDDFRKLLRLDENHEHKLEEIVRLGPELEPCLGQLVGMRMMRPSCAHETLFSFLCSANNHISRITQMVWKLSTDPSGGVRDDHLAPVAFLSTEEIGQLSEQSLRSQGFGYRAKSIPEVARQLAGRGDSKAVLEQLRDAQYADARAHLLSLPGVGPKLADCICLFAFDHQESVPIDTHIWQQLTKIYYPEWVGTALTKVKYDHAAEAFRDRFGALAGVAHQFLFVENMAINNRRNNKKITV